MSRNLNVIGFAVIAAFAMSAAAASVAQAEEPAQLTAESTPAVVSGKQLGAWVLARATRNITCGVIKSQEEATSGSSTFSAGTPTVENCTTNLGGPATVRTNGCAFLFHLTASKEDVWTAISDFICPPGKKGEILLYVNHTAHTEEKPVCVYEFLTQEGLGSVQLTNEPASAETPKDWLRADIQLQGIASKRVFGSILICGPENSSNGSISGEAELKGANVIGEPVGITISTGE